MATDKRLDQVSTLTDFDYALIVKGDQVAKVTSAQLSSLITSMISKSSAMMNEIHSLYMRNNYSGDLDGLGSGTFVFATGEATNLPNPGTPGFVFTTKQSNGYANQLFVNHSQKFMRTYIYNKWQKWQRIDNFGYNTLEELASGVAEQNHITIGSNAGLRVSYSQTYDTSYYPAAHGSVLRVGDNVKSGIGFELFFGYGGGLWNKNEGENTWKKIL